MPSDPNIRAADDDRARAVAELRQHTKAGRLSEAEFKARAARVESAATVGEVGAVFTDLPRADATKGKSWRASSQWKLWLSLSLVTWAIWGATVATSNSHSLQGIWPIWVTVPWGALILGDVIRRG